MRLAVDTSALVAEAFRARGQHLITHPALDLLIAAEAWDETMYELRRRSEHMALRGLVDGEAAATLLLRDIVRTVSSSVAIVQTDSYAEHMEEARRRIPRDPNDAPTVALALALDCGIWTADRDFFGCGVPVWITETLAAHLDAADAP